MGNQRLGSTAALTRAEIGQRRSARTRASLVKAAMKVFARLGPDAPTIDDFVAEAGVARGTFYNYFETREDLLIEVATEVSEQLLADMAAVRRLSDPADRVGCSVRMFIRKAASDPVWGWIIVRIAVIAAPIGASMRAYMTADIEEGLVSGRFRSPSPQAAYDVVLGLGLMGMRSVLRGDAGPTHAEDVAQMVLRAFGVSDATEVSRRPMDPGVLAARARASAGKAIRGAGVSGGRSSLRRREFVKKFELWRQSPKGRCWRSATTVDFRFARE